ncbi:Bcr/CflA family multidrug efflux MFS transporter [Photobacterium sp. WH77]|uniref:Bcr/CflA family efflux transporter n=1 Tax=Photobacterium arenosum TaxID=2774143 RepID=A0ABR9BQM4_9GAMM|nr:MULTISPECIES: purine nucleoside transporter PunC [Photobacterium]MBD8513892.1 Bcr/CflA family multidrug efflux MFS transporter [Photobacterium arenosum]MBV7262466.1 Bcr/CflA family multidrug efflux MFS transporter [Photobacterium sp. WH24]MCG2836356.1 Bcr/CflA family multidrug efflux MFS transporter [Photobacterium sp. WH77]MCG2844017.1 Bcr/CflA family multidrug efflux MFS transporter [Photobacterium sp. WH80]MDO6580443.1 purine nucleoside transporter PunC [Photobacterium sp. 2_MG-2023]
MTTKPTTVTLAWFALLSMLGFLATDMYLPAFTAMQADLNTSSSLIGMTLGLFLLGMAIGQLIYGPLSDRLGRKKVLLGAMLLFSLATLGCAMAPNVETLLAFRFLQALGACSATVLWQAIVIDRYEGKLAEKVFATIMPLVALSPALAPLVGAAIQSHFGWRAIFLSLIALGAVLALMTTMQPESAKGEKKQGNVLSELAINYTSLLKSKKFMGNMLIFAACSAAFFAYLTGSPFIMSAMGYSSEDIGLSYVPQTIAFLIGGYGCRALLNRMEGKKLLPWLLKLFIGSALVILLITVQHKPDTIWPVLLPFCFIAVANGAIYPIVISKALEDFKHCSATAAGVMNFLQTLGCFAASSLVAAFADKGLSIVAFSIAGTCVFVLIGFAFVVSSQRQQLIEAQSTPN